MNTTNTTLSVWGAPSVDKLREPLQPRQRLIGQTPRCTLPSSDHDVDPHTGQPQRGSHSSRSRSAASSKGTKHRNGAETATYFEFREPTSGDELQALLRIHERVYSKSTGLSEFTTASDEANHFDSHQAFRHFGLFECVGNESRAVGYVRVVEVFASKKWPRLPLLDYFSRNTRVWAMLRRVVRKYGVAIEGGSLSLLPEVNVLRASKHIVESLVALYGVALDVPCFLVCFPHHQRFYESLGFRRIFRDESIRTPSGHLTGVCMYGVRIRKARAQRRLRAMCQAYRKFGAIAYHRENRENFAPDVIRADSMGSILRLATLAAA